MMRRFSSSVVAVFSCLLAVSTAGALQLSQGVTHLAVITDVTVPHQYTFELSQESLLRVYVSSDGSQSALPHQGTTIRWLDESGTEIKSAPAGFTFPYIDVMETASAGTYQFEITGQYTGTYNICVNCDVEESEPNNDIATAPSLPIGHKITGFITSEDKIDMYRYVLTQPGRLTANVGLGSSSDGGLYYADILWYDSDGTEIKSTNASSDYMDLEAGIYYIGITQYYDYTGTYDFSGNFTAAENNEIEPNSTLPEAQLLAFDQTIRGFISHQDKIDMYQFELVQPGRLTMNGVLGNYSIGGIIRWYDSNGTEIKSNTTVGTFNYYMDLETGTYYIGITRESGSGTGTYDLNGNFTAAENNEIEPNSNRAEAMPLAFGQTVKGFISHQDTTDMYRFELVQQDRLTINGVLGNASIGGIIRWYDSNGIEIKSNTTVGTFNYYMDLEAGTYYIGITRESRNGTGTYTITGTALNHVAVLESKRDVPVNPTEDAAVIAPVNVSAFEVTAGPNPVRKSDGVVKIFVTGKRIDDGTLTVYDASGNVINKINVRDNVIGNNTVRRIIGNWDLKDGKGVSVSSGTYLLRGVVETAGGKRERVSVVVGVR